MSDPEHGFRQPVGAGLSGVAADFIAALGEIWAKGFAAWQAMSGTTPFADGDRSGAPAADPLAAMLGPMASVAAAFGEMLPRRTSLSATAEASRAALSQWGDLSPAMAEAGMIAAASTLRYWRALAEICTRHQSGVMQAAMDRATDRAMASPAECRALAGELRAFLREIGEAASQEARRLQAELEQVSESIAHSAAAGEPAPPAAHRRRHRVKE